MPKSRLRGGKKAHNKRMKKYRVEKENLKHKMGVQMEQQMMEMFKSMMETENSGSNEDTTGSRGEDQQA